VQKSINKSPLSLWSSSLNLCFICDIASLSIRAFRPFNIMIFFFFLISHPIVPVGVHKTSSFFSRLCYVQSRYPGKVGERWTRSPTKWKKGRAASLSPGRRPGSRRKNQVAGSQARDSQLGARSIATASPEFPPAPRMREEGHLRGFSG